jgi:hypothetical protein
VEWKKTARPLYPDISTKKIERVKERASAASARRSKAIRAGLEIALAHEFDGQQLPRVDQCYFREASTMLKRSVHNDV